MVSLVACMVLNSDEETIPLNFQLNGLPPQATGGDGVQQNQDTSLGLARNSGCIDDVKSLNTAGSLSERAESASSVRVWTHEYFKEKAGFAGKYRLYPIM